MKIKSWQFILIMVALFLIIIMLAWGVPTLFAISLSTYIIFLVLLCGNLEKNIYVIAFMITFFTFVMGSMVAIFIFGVQESRSVMNDIVVNHTALTQIASICGLSFGILCGRRIVSPFLDSVRKDCTYSESLRLVSRRVFYVSYICAVMELSETILFVARSGYISSYTSFTTSLPFVVRTLSDIMPICFFMFLATFPEKREAKAPIAMYLVLSLLHILTGKRYQTVAVIIIIIVYCIMRNHDGNGVKWISKRFIISMVCLAPLGMIALYSYSYIRAGLEVNNDLYSNGIIAFLSRTGSGSRVIDYEYIYHDVLPQGKIYSFGQIIEYLSNGVRVLLGQRMVTPSYTAQYATNGNLLSYALTYTVFPNRFANAYGLGSCYIAELYHDLGYIGVILGNFFIGYILTKLTRFDSKSTMSNFLMLFLFEAILRMPRDSFCLPLNEIINVKNLSCLFLLIIISKHIQGKANRVNV